MAMNEVRREIYEYFYRETEADLVDTINAVDADANTIYGALKHLKWEDYLDSDTGNNTFWLTSSVPGLCPKCGEETELNDSVMEDCPYCDWTETWTCPHCGSTDPHDAIEFPSDERFDNEVEVDVTCQSVYITPIDGGDGFAFNHEEFEQIIEHFEESEYR